MSQPVRVSILLLATLVTACGAEDDTKVDPRTAVEGFDPSLNARTEVAQIHEAARDNPEGVQSVALDNLDASDPEVHWAAVYALSISATPDDEGSVSKLTEIMGSSDLDDRLNAAGSLAAMGTKEALPVLIELLDSDEQLRYLVFPAWRVAGDILLASTEEDFGVLDAEDANARADLKAAWQDWWEQEGPTLEWNPEQGTFG